MPHLIRRCSPRPAHKRSPGYQHCTELAKHFVALMECCGATKGEMPIAQAGKAGSWRDDWPQGRPWGDVDKGSGFSRCGRFLRLTGWEPRPAGGWAGHQPLSSRHGLSPGTARPILIIPRRMIAARHRRHAAAGDAGRRRHLERLRAGGAEQRYVAILEQGDQHHASGEAADMRPEGTPPSSAELPQPDSTCTANHRPSTITAGTLSRRI